MRSNRVPVQATSPVSLTVLSNSPDRFREVSAGWRVPVRYLPWRPTTFDAGLALHDVAVLPVSRNPFTECKSSNRVLTALWAGLAVVADGIPSYRDFADCVVLDDWELGLGRYASAEARRADVALGRARIEAEWRQPAITARWRSLLVSVVGGAIPAGSGSAVV